MQRVSCKQEASHHVGVFSFRLHRHAISHNHEDYFVKWSEATCSLLLSSLTSEGEGSALLEIAGRQCLLDMGIVLSNVACPRGALRLSSCESVRIALWLCVDLRQRLLKEFVPSQDCIAFLFLQNGSAAESVVQYLLTPGSRVCSPSLSAFVASYVVICVECKLVLSPVVLAGLVDDLDLQNAQAHDEDEVMLLGGVYTAYDRENLVLLHRIRLLLEHWERYWAGGVKWWVSCLCLSFAVC
jgi:hypothetical protein